MDGDRGLALVAQVPGQLLQVDLVELQATNPSYLLIAVLESFNLNFWNDARVECARWLFNQSERRCLRSIESLVWIDWCNYEGRITAVGDALENSVFANCIDRGLRLWVQDGVNVGIKPNLTTFEDRCALIFVLPIKLVLRDVGHDHTAASVHLVEGHSSIVGLFC